MKLRQTTLLMIGVTLAGLVGGLYLVSSQILFRSLTTAEQQGVQQTVEGVRNVLTQTQEDFSDRFADWAAWDDAYTFVQDRNTRFIETNLVPQTFINLKVNLIIFVNSSGQVVFGKGLNLATQQATPIPPALQQHLLLNDPLLSHSSPDSRISGILLLPEGPMLITARPILNSEQQGPIRGTIIFGRYLDEPVIRKLSRITRFPLQLQRYDNKALPDDFQAAKEALSVTHPIAVRPLSEAAIAGYTIIPDLYSQPSLLLRIDTPRDIYLRGRRSQRYLILAIVFVGVVFGGVTLLLLERLVLFRLAILIKDVKGVGQQHDPSMRVQVDGSDELAELATTINWMLGSLQKSLSELEEEREKSERLLLNILPAPIANRLKHSEMTIADHFTEATVLFADIVDFTQLSTRISPTELVALLNQIFSVFDHLAEQHGLEKIKTIGDAYMVVGGLPMPRKDHAAAVAQMALDMQAAIAQFNASQNETLHIRIGINSGPVVAGVIGTKKFIYDLWGDTVNIASRMESGGVKGSIQVTAITYEYLKDQFYLTERGLVEVKGKGKMEAYLLEGKKPNLAKLSTIS